MICSPRRTNLLIRGLLALLFLVPPLVAQSGDESDDLGDLSIEELLSIRVPSMTSVLGGHVHNEGEWMYMFHVMRMHMDGLRDGTSDLSTADVLGTYMVSPTRMTMDMFMAGVMYGWSDRLTLMAMLPYSSNSMDHRTGMGARFTTKSEGIGDLEVSAIRVLWEDYDAHLYLYMGLSAPTGSIEETDATPMGPKTKLPYPMQLGSGTFDVRPGLTYAVDQGPQSYGAQVRGTFRIGENSEDYTLGNRMELATWYQRSVNESFALSAKLTGRAWGNIDGADPELNPAMVPTADPDLQGGERVDLSVGFLLSSGSGSLAGHRLEMEFGKPIYESLDGPQMTTDWVASLHWSVTF